MSYINPSYYPFGPVNPVSGAAAINYDLDIYEAYPGLVLIPTEPNGVYVAFREVDGCAWWVLNADWSTADLQWEQNSPQNPALPAYALEQCSNGTVTRYVAAATNTPGTQVEWIPVWSMDALGNITQSPQTTDAANQVTLKLDPTWDAGTSVIMSCLEQSITDTSSSASSWLENFLVNSTPVWQVRKDGTLVTGKIPFSNVTGYTPPTTFNNATFTGTTTFNGPIQANDGATIDGGLVLNSGALFANDGAYIVGGITADNADVTGNLQVGGTATIHNLDVTGTVTLPAGTVPVENITGSNGIVVTNASGTYNVSGGTLVNTIESTDGSITVTTTGQTVNLEVTAHSSTKVIRAYIRVPVTETTPFSQSLSLPTLPGSSSQGYQLYASAGWPSNTGGTQTLTGSGATWESAQSAAGTSGVQPIDLNGTAVGGQTPSVVWTASNVDGVYTNSITLQIIAYPT